jgi:hypothetical protein
MLQRRGNINGGVEPRLTIEGVSTMALFEVDLKWLDAERLILKKLNGLSDLI